MRRADLIINNSGFSLRLFRSKSLNGIGVKIKQREDRLNIKPTTLNKLQKAMVVHNSSLDLTKLRKNISLLNAENFRETAELSKKEKIAFMQDNIDLILQIVAARFSKDKTLEVTEGAIANFELFQALKEAAFKKAEGILKKNPTLELEPFIKILVALLTSHQWGKVSKKTGKKFKKYSVEVWQKVLKIVSLSPLAVINIDGAFLNKIFTNSVKAIEAAIKTLELRRNNGGIYVFSDKQIVELATSHNRIDMILSKIKKYSSYPKQLRPPISHIIKIGLCRLPEKRFEFIDQKIRESPSTIFPFVALAILRNFEEKIAGLNELISEGKEIGLNNSLAARMLQTGISVKDLTAFLGNAKKENIELSVSSAVIMLQRGISVKDLTTFLDNAKKENIELSTSSAVIMLQAGISVKGLTTLLGNAKKENIELSVSSAVKMLQGKISIKDYLAFTKKLGVKIKSWKVIAILTNKEKDKIIKKLYEFIDGLTRLKKEHKATIEQRKNEAIIPAYFIELALYLDCLSHGKHDFIETLNLMKQKILINNTTNLRIFFKKEWFPLYLKLSTECFGNLPLVLGKKQISGSKEVFAIARMEDFVYGKDSKKTLHDIIASETFPSPVDMASISLMATRAQKILGPKEYQELINFFLEYGINDVPNNTRISALIAKIRENLTGEYEEL